MESAVRRPYLDNIRSVTTVLVVIYHVAYIFNSAGVISNVNVRGIPAVDANCYFLYPWFMCLMFLIAGMSARYSLQTRSAKQFAKERVRKLIVPLFGGSFLIGWLNGWVTSQYADLFGGHEMPLWARYLIYVMNIGPLWFLLDLFLASMLLLLVRKLDRHDKLLALGEKFKFPLLLLLVLPVWGSGFVLNTPVVIVFRNGIYWFLFLLGYYVFSHQTVLETVKRYGGQLLAVAMVLGIVQTWYFFGENYVSDACLRHPLTNAYLWLMILGILGSAQRFLDFNNPLTQYLKKRSYALYVFHYPFLGVAAYVITTYAALPMLLNYMVLLCVAFTASLLLYEITSRIPVIRYWLLGMKREEAAMKK